MITSSVHQESPFNAKNVVFHIHDLLCILQTYADSNMKPSDIDIYRRAFVHRSYCKRKNETVVNSNIGRPHECIPLQEDSNERLEFLGDSVVGLVIASYLFERYPDQNEGFLTQLRTKLVNGQRLGELARVVGLDKWVLVSKQIEDANGRNNTKILEDVFEAFIGAMFIDLGFENTSSWIIGLIESQINFAELVCMTHSHKDVLVKHFQHTFNTLPKFTDVTNKSNEDASVCSIAIVDPAGTILAIGSGPNRRAAENDAARLALLTVGKHR